MVSIKQVSFLAFACFASLLNASEIITAGDGKQYQLNDNGTWEQVSTNRYLDTPDGRRVVLKPDGNWEYVGLAPEVTEEKFQNLELAAEIDNIEVNETREAVGGGKNTRITYQTVVSLRLSLAKEAATPLALDQLKLSDFLLTDNRDRKYPIETVEASVNSLAPGQTTTLLITSNKAPKRLRKIAEFVVKLNAETVGNTDDIVLTYNYDLVKRNTSNN